MTRRKKPYIDPARGARFAHFCAKYLRHMKGTFAGQPFVLEDWQLNDIITPLFGTVDPKTNLRQYREAVIGLPRKNGKSELSAAIALYGLVADGEFGSEIYSVAGSKAQASLVFQAAKGMVQASPQLRAVCKPYRNVIEVPETGAIYRVLSADADLQHGLNPHIAIIDEYHVHRNSEQYEAMRTGMAARQQPLTITISTAGAEKRGPMWELLQRAQQSKDPRMFLYWRGMPLDGDVLDRALWREANPASWVKMDFLEDQFNSLPLPVFARLHLNMWHDGDSANFWIPQEWWNNCEGDVTIDPHQPSVIAVDAAPRRDTTAISIVQRDEAGIFHSRTFIFKSDEEMGYLDFQIVEDLLRELCSQFYVTRVAFDPYNMVRSQQVLASEGIPTEVFPQNDARMVPASQLLYDLIREGKVRHDGEEMMANQIMNVGVFETARGWRIHKKKSKDKVDGVVALAMACQLADWENELSGGPRVMVV